MRVLLLNPPYLKGFVRISRCYWLPLSGSLWYPIFLAYCAGFLEKHGHKIKLLDAIAEGLNQQKTIDLAKRFKPDLLVLYTSYPSLENDISIGGQIKKVTGCLLVLVGPGPWSNENPKKILEDFPHVDVVVKQEFDKPVLAIANGQSFNKIKGIAWQKKGQVVDNPGSDFVSAQELDKFPFVTKVYKEHLPIKNYYQASLLHPFVDLFTARGCVWGKCTFCLWPQTMQKEGAYRVRSISNVVAELRYIKKSLPQVKEIFFQDDMLPQARANELSEAILQNKLNIVWSGYAKANLPLSTLKIMKKAGCRFLHVGFESTDPKILADIKKGVTLGQMERFVKDAKKAGIQIHGDFIVGLPGETNKTIRKTVDWAKKQELEACQFSVPEANPTTQLHTWLKQHNYLTSGNKPSYPHLSITELDAWRYQAMRELNLRPKFLFQTLKNIKNPQEFLRLVHAGFYLIPNLLFTRRKAV